VVLLLTSGCGEDPKPVSPGERFDGLLKEGKLEEAEKFCRENVRKKDTDEQVHRGNLAHVLCLLGERALQEAGYFDADPEKAKKSREHRKFGEARRYFREAATQGKRVFEDVPKSKWKGYAKVRATIGLALYRLERVSEAIKELERAVADDEHLATAHNTLGLIYHEQGKQEAAVANFKAALKAEPGMAEAAYNLGVYFEDELSELARVERDARKAGSAPPKDAAARRKTAREEAIKYYRRYLQVRTGDRRKKDEVRRRIMKLSGGASAAPSGAPRAA
jgi:tetratricopeptide (TPR) repeat protein